MKFRSHRVLLLIGFISVATTLALAQQAPRRAATRPARAAASAARAPATRANNAVEATPAEKIHALKDFKVELLHTVPAETEGSWVCMCVDPKGRLIVCDQYGGLFRVTPPALDGSPNETKAEPIPAKVGSANGLLWAFDSLYVVVNDYVKPANDGVYRVRSSKGDDVLDTVEPLRLFEGG